MIRKANADDLVAVRDLALLLWPGNDPDGLRDEMSGILSDNNAAIFLCFIDGEAVGFAQCQLRFDYVEGTESSPVGYLEGIFVDEGHRMKGVARELLGCCESWATDRGCAELASDCDLHNSGSLAFHLKAGFEEANRIICLVKRL